MLTLEREKEIRECPGCKDYHRDELLAEIDRLREEIVAIIDALEQRVGLYDTERALANIRSNK